jgi:hypothetical protein
MFHCLKNLFISRTTIIMQQISIYIIIFIPIEIMFYLLFQEYFLKYIEFDIKLSIESWNI